MQRSGIGWLISSTGINSLVALPLIALAWISLHGDSGGSGEIWSHLIDTVLADYVINSLALMLGVAILTLALGVGSAYLVTHYDFFGKKTLTWALLLPLAVPTYITAYSYTGLLDVAGPVQSALRNGLNLSVNEYWFPSIRSLPGAIFVMSFVLYPYVYLLARAAFIEQSRHLRDVAQLLGYSQRKAFFKITLPIARPAVVAGVSLVLMETLADYGAVSYFGVSTFTTGIFRTWYGLDSVAGAAQLAIMLLSFVVILMFIEKQSRRRAGYQSVKSGKPAMATQLNGKANLLATTLAATPIMLGFLIPVFQLFIWAIKTREGLLSLEFWRLVMNTLGLASLTAVLALLLALIVAYAHRLQPNKLTSFNKRAASLGYAVPGTVIAVGILTPLAIFDNTVDAWFRANIGFSTGLLLSGSLAALVIAYLVRFLAVALGSVESGLGSIHNNIDQAARSLGHKPMAVIRNVHVPILRSSVFTAVLIVFVDVMKELPATLILRPFNFNTLAVRAYELAGDERLMDASLASISIVLVGLLPVILLTRASLKSG